MSNKFYFKINRCIIESDGGAHLYLAGKYSEGTLQYCTPYYLDELAVLAAKISVESGLTIHAPEGQEKIGELCDEVLRITNEAPTLVNYINVGGVDVD